MAAFGQELVGRLGETLDGRLVGAYFVGSVALGGYVPRESDVDVVAVSEHPVPIEERSRIAQTVVECAPTCPARGLEFTLYRREVAAAIPKAADF